ncbi:MAG TPA: zinc-ribbon domain-containing protein [bacterium]|nr:zinc-ribbon domain-containing protein [bacterium]
MFCHKCGKELLENAKFCDNCGTKIKEKEDNLKNIPIEKEKDLIKKDGNINKTQWGDLAITSFILGILSMLLASIGIIPLIALIVSIFALIKMKQMKKSSKIFTIIGFIFAVLYCINFFMVFSAIGPNFLNLRKDSKTNLYNYPKITWMEYNKAWGGTKYDGDWTINWAFENGRYKNAWDCYRGCEMLFTDNDSGHGEILFSSQMPTQNGCDTWHKVSKEINSRLAGTKSFCINISCADGKVSEPLCWESN